MFCVRLGRLRSLKTFALIPVKKLSKSKERLSMVFKPEERKRFVLSMLEDILRVTSSSVLHQTVVIGSDRIVQLVAEKFDAYFLPESGGGLNDALRYAVSLCEKRGAKAVLILPADIPLMKERDLNEIIHLSWKASVVISPSMDGGTNALMLKPPNVIKTCFGPRSFKKHIDEALKKGIPVRVYRSPGISLDIDSIQDLKTLLKVGKGKACHRFLMQIKMNVRLKEIEPSARFLNLL